MPRGHVLDLRWNALLREFRRSGLTQAAFCERREISIHSFRKHLYCDRSGIQRQFRAFGERQAKSRRSWCLFPEVRDAKPVSFFVLFPRDAFDWRASVSFASWIALGASRPWALPR